MPDIDSKRGGSTITFAQFCRESGYDPKTRRYRRTAADNAPRAVPGAHMRDKPQDVKRRTARAQ